MQKITFGNKEYKKASEIAKQFRYTQDYVGQLCRSGKVDARLVGRVWYVEPTSVQAYRRTKHTSLKKTKKRPVPASAHVSNTRTPVEPVLRSVTAKSVSARSQSSTATAPTRLSVTYSSDDEVAVLPVATQQAPVVTKATITKAARVKKLKIRRRSSQKNTTYVTEKTPEIALSGSLSVYDYSEPDVATMQGHRQATKSDQTKPSTSQSVSDAPDVNQITRLKETKAEHNSTASEHLSGEIAVGHVAPEIEYQRSGLFSFGFQIIVTSMLAGVIAAGVLSLVGETLVLNGAARGTFTLQFDLTQLLSLLFG